MKINLNNRTSVVPFAALAAGELFNFVDGDDSVLMRTDSDLTPWVNLVFGNVSKCSRSTYEQDRVRRLIQVRPLEIEG